MVGDCGKSNFGGWAEVEDFRGLKGECENGSQTQRLQAVVGQSGGKACDLELTEAAV